MREIKFRGWYEDIGMLPVVDLSAPKSTHEWLGSLDVKLMQYTGLEDKNGKMIFEGDVLGTSNANPEYDIWKIGDWEHHVVKWIDSCCGFNLHGDHDEDSVYNLKYMEVIGNIYETPELLK